MHVDEVVSVNKIDEGHAESGKHQDQGRDTRVADGCCPSKSVMMNELLVSRQTYL